MSRQSPFFKFDAIQWLAGSIQFCTLEEKGLFIDLCAMYWDSQKPVKIDDKFKVRYRYLEGTLSNLIGTLSNLEIITESEAGITIPFLDILINERQDFLEKCSKAGVKSASIKGCSSNKKEERRKKSVERRKKSVETRKESVEDFKDIYRSFEHLSISVDEFEKLISEGYTKDKIDTILDNIENYADNKKYKSLVLTARNWLKNDKKRIDKMIADLNLESPEWDAP